mgnify:CR=1 FL=1
MVDVYMTRMYELMIILYAASTFAYFIDFIYNNRKAKQFAFWLLAIVWILQTIFLFIQMIVTGRFPVLSITEGLYFYAWVLVTLSLFVQKFLKIEFIVFFTNILGFIAIVIHTFAPNRMATNVMADQLVSELLFIHITMAILSYGAFTLSFIFSILYLIQYDLLKRKKWGKTLLRIQDLSKLEHLAFILSVIGLPLLLFSLILGIQWAYLKIPNMTWFDSKVLGSFIVIIVYCIYLFVKMRKEMYGKNLALFNVASFLIVLINFFLFGRLSSFHDWNN